MEEPRPDVIVAGLLERLEAVGGTAWVVRGQLRLRPLDAIPDDLIAALHTNAKETIKQVQKRPKRLRDRVFSPEKRFMTRIRTELLRNIHGEPSKAQKLLVDRIAWLSWHVNCFDVKALEAGGMSAHATREYLAYSNSLERCTRHLMEMKSGTPKQAKSADPWSNLTTDPS